MTGPRWINPMLKFAKFLPECILLGWPVVATLLLPGRLCAEILYSQTFEGTTLATVGFGYWSISTGAPAVVREVTATGGVGGSQGFAHYFDGTSGSSYLFAFNNILQPIAASDADPLPVSDAAKIRFSMDVKTIGSLTSTPIRISVWQTDDNYEADRGIDLNSDGDMADSAIVFGSSFWPTVLDGNDYIGISFTIDQGTLFAAQNNPPPIGSIPLTPQFDPTLPLVWSVTFGSEGFVFGDGFDYGAGFGFDAGNILSVDNILVETVPEPSTIVALGIAFVCISALRVRCRTPREMHPIWGRQGDRSI
jgi:hypothetical protein